MFSLFSTFALADGDIPVWPKKYNFRGFWSIPYWPSLREPIEVFTDLSDPDHPKQSISFFSKQYIQVDNGLNSYLVQQNQNGTDCALGDHEDPVEFLPNLSKYTEMEQTVVNGRNVRKFHYLPLPDDRPDFYYDFYIDLDKGYPVRFFQHGRSIMDSHPANYVLDFEHFAPTAEESHFIPPYQCSLNPNSLNTIKNPRKNLISRFDLGALPKVVNDDDYCEIVDHVDIEGDLPVNFSWRDRNVIGIPRDQAACGSCWAQSSSKAITGQISLHYHKLIETSAQQIIDCTWETVNDEDWNKACNGGNPWLAFKQLNKYSINISTEEDYPYIGISGTCSSLTADNSHRNVSGYGRVIGCKHFFINSTKYSDKEDLIKKALYKYGPMSILIRVVGSKFGIIGNEVYDDPKCMPTPTEGTNHAVTLTGWTDKAWEFQNSWSDLWGDNGYGYISFNHDCGISEEVILPIMEFDD